MDNQVLCPHCKKPIPLNEALTHEVREKYKKFIEEDRRKRAEIFEQKLAEERSTFTKNFDEKVKKRLEEEVSLKLKDAQNEKDELKQQNKNLQEQLLELNKLIRQLRNEREIEKIENQKKLSEEETKIREQESKSADERNKLKYSELEKKLNDALKVNEQLSRKLQQGSQQLQGEVLELELENILKAEFPYDDIKPVGKGVLGADIVQIVKDQMGRVCGTIIWETKRTKTWASEWIPKLKDDQRRLHAEIAVIVSEILPSDVKHSRLKDGVWVTSFQYFTALAFALRQNLLNVAVIKNSQVGKNEKMEILYNYFNGTEFQQRVEAILEAFTSVQDDLEKEKRWFTQKWAKQERNIRQVIDNTVGLRGAVESITGKSLPEVKDSSLLPHSIDSKVDQDSLI